MSVSVSASSQHGIRVYPGLVRQRWQRCLHTAKHDGVPSVWVNIVPFSTLLSITTYLDALSTLVVIKTLYAVSDKNRQAVRVSAITARHIHPVSLQLHGLKLQQLERYEASSLPGVTKMNKPNQQC
jgi:hypothetical protein